MSQVIALDLFAGTGWGVACKRLGIEEYGVEIMPEAVKTRELHGMQTIFHDVWDGLEQPKLISEAMSAARMDAIRKVTDPDADPSYYELLIASPPCQTFSNAGKGSGVRALREVVDAIDAGAYKDVAKLRELADSTDPKTALVLTPLAYVWRDRPRLVVLEQVPPVLPVWHAMAAVMRTIGYSVVVEILDAECYGVPQTRDRAILIGRLDGMADMPVPTHSRYYSGDPTRMDSGVLPWVSMAEALGWGGTVAGDPRLSARTHHEHGEQTMTVDSSEVRDAFVRIITNQDSDLGHGKKRRYSRLTSAPIATVTGQVRNFKKSTNTDADDRRGVKVTVEEAALLQSYPAGFEFCGSDSKKYLQIGNAVPVLLAQAILTAVLLPARERTFWDQVFAEVAS